MDDATRREIDKVCWRTLKEAGITEPPSNTKLIWSTWSYIVSSTISKILVSWIGQDTQCW